jgi:hypothetical protein
LGRRHRARLSGMGALHRSYRGIKG